MFLFCVSGRRLRLFGKKDSKDKEKRGKKPVKIIVMCGLAFLTFLGGLIAFLIVRMPSHSYCEQTGEYSLMAENNSQVEDFFEQFGFDAEYLFAEDVRIPSAGEEFEEYNRLQKSQGLNLIPYRGKSGKIYTVLLCSDEKEDETLFGVAVVYRDRVVAAHITDGRYPAFIRPVFLDD